ncbi:YggS family pyridoxal phosphate-dependent enzyme [Pseudoduganella sp. FT25W]|uniref:Pyridoxal phosphate homeostasis protein n=1 Tax=Duganella alba TaxID=2666081 RepID=A0A6L5QJ72_9BURK|nr:YggS family pyridoxal phosphate-dependent enzyme [Duganella alba]MRX09789.1 YggS family pyridoxal phosphate-dependent enzyme [Duganella alba]MRX17426.1 YggS family pyridoxal phosphate-dependent enzyme [Duganella alba]
MSPIRQNLQAITTTIVAAAQESGRQPASVQLLAVSKTFGPEAVLEAVAAGQRAFGENYLQEGLDKIRAVQEAGAPALEWHFIGPIQSNKTRPIAEHFAWVHTVEREKIAQRLSEQRPAGMAPLQICLQVNISGEASKSGVAPNELAALAHKVAALPNLTLRGLMAIPEPADDFDQQRAAFAQLRTLYEQLRADGLALDTLSMGMSADMRAAIVEGATIVRVGSAIFGARNYDKA